MLTEKIGIIILAAGESKRLGRPKQLLKFRNKTLIALTIEKTLRTKKKEIIVVLGSNAERINTEISNFPVKICINKEWKNGMASSIKFGLEKLTNEYPAIDAALILLCDQPLINSEQINSFIEEFSNTEKQIIAAKYKNTIGVPAIFSKDFFVKLLKLKGNLGAKAIIKQFPDQVKTMDIPEAEFDIDTIEDVQKLKEL